MRHRASAAVTGQAARKPSWRHRTRPRDDGAATPVAAALLAVTVAVALAIAQSGALVGAAARADSAADLAALAAARVDRDARALGASSTTSLHKGCAAAGEVAAHNGARVTSCARAAGRSVQVTVAVDVASWPRDAIATARAGPVTPVP